MSFISSILGSAKDDFKGGVANAANSLVRGEIGDAASALTGIATNLVSNIGARGGAPFGDGFKGSQQIRDVVQDWCWYCVLPSVGGMQLPWYYVTSANTPFRQFNVETLPRNGHPVPYVESYQLSGNLNLKFLLDGSSKSASYLKTWAGQILWDHDPSQAINQGVWGMPSGYLKTITIVVMSVSRKELLTFKYFGCFPSNPQALEVGAGTANAMELSVEFQVEDVELTIRNDLGLLENLKDSVKGLAMGVLTGGIASALGSFKAVPTGLNVMGKIIGR